MGCFISTNKSNSPSPFTKSSRAPPPRSPPSPHPLEESVKEVLSETPKFRTTPPKFSKTPKTRANLLPDVQQFNKKYDLNLRNNPKMVNAEENSEVSELYSSMSESFSTTTERIDNVEKGEIRQRVDRSPEKFNRRSYSNNKQREVAKSPARKPEQPSPNRVRIVPGRDRRFDATDGKDIRTARDAGESSRRRSKSPAIRNENNASRQNLGRSPSARKPGKSPSRVRSDLSEKSRKGDRGNKEGKRPPTSSELLENPLVSLECFIFL